MKTAIRKKGKYLCVSYYHQKDRLDFCTGWIVPDEYMCSETEVSPAYTYYNEIMEELVMTFELVDNLIRETMDEYGEPTVENMRLYVLNSSKVIRYPFFEDFQALITLEFLKVNKEQFQKLIELRELLIEFEVFSMVPVDKELFELGYMHEFKNFLLFVKKVHLDDFQELIDLLDIVMDKMSV